VWIPSAFGSAVARDTAVTPSQKRTLGLFTLLLAVVTMCLVDGAANSFRRLCNNEVFAA